MSELKIEYVPIDSIKPYKGNAKLHPDAQVEQIMNSIKEFGFQDPVGVWHDEIVEGHGRLMAAKKLGINTIPIIRLDDLTDEQRRAYSLIHNKLTMNSDFDLDVLSDELDNILDIDMSLFDFGVDDIIPGQEETRNKYIEDIKAPQYELKGENPRVDELVNTDKARELERNIEKTDIPDEIKNFLLMAAKRHYRFDYSKIAEFYAHADKEVQKLMEESALVIIDYDDAMLHGYVELSEKIDKVGGEDEE